MTREQSSNRASLMLRARAHWAAVDIPVGNLENRQLLKPRCNKRIVNCDGDSPESETWDRKRVVNVRVVHTATAS